MGRVGRQGPSSEKNPSVEAEAAAAVCSEGTAVQSSALCD